MKKIALIIILVFIPITVFATDILIYSKETWEDDANVAILDFDDTGGDITLQFGNTLSEQLTWDNGNGQFVFTDDLSVQGNITLTGQINNTTISSGGTSFTLDADNTGAGANTSIISEQGTDNNGEIRYNATSNYWDLSNDGGTFYEIDTIKSPPAVQARRSTTLSPGTSFADVTFDQTDVETDTTGLEHDNTNTDRILINADGLYAISYDGSTGDILLTEGTLFARVRVNDTTVLNGSVSQTSITVEDQEFSQSFIAELSNGDFISLQIDRDSTAFNVLADLTFVVYRLQ